MVLGLRFYGLPAWMQVGSTLYGCGLKCEWGAARFVKTLVYERVRDC